MQITDIRIRKIAKEGKMKAVVSVTFDNAFVVHDIKVIDGERRGECQAAAYGDYHYRETFFAYQDFAGSGYCGVGCSPCLFIDKYRIGVV